ncbi:hypothetical protein TNCV_2533581 [Trichonephila clavipes]|nr:hypothetical protein TNCV_2533581 [Trichonephila clavipes]
MRTTPVPVKGGMCYHSSLANLPGVPISIILDNIFDREWLISIPRVCGLRGVKFVYRAENINNFQTQISRVHDTCREIKQVVVASNPSASRRRTNFNSLVDFTNPNCARWWSKKYNFSRREEIAFSKFPLYAHGRSTENRPPSSRGLGEGSVPEARTFGKDTHARDRPNFPAQPNFI